MTETLSMIPDWDKVYNTCYFCHSDISVKYQISIGGMGYPICDHCITRIVGGVTNGNDQKGEL